jgi:hypothetical protein
VIGEDGRYMLQDRRKTQRHAVSGRARISVPGLVVGHCLVADISEGGARIVVEGTQVPETFLLSFEEIDGDNGSRECRVAWRLDNEIGVEFVDTAEEGFALRLLR